MTQPTSKRLVTEESLASGPAADLLAADIPNPASPVGGALATTIDTAIEPKVDKGNSKGGGQNPAELRRPTLTIDRQFPTVTVDHAPVWASGDTIYATGQDRRLRKSTTGGISWSAKGDPGVTKAFARNGLFVKTAANTLLTTRHDTGTNALDGLYRSTDDGNTWTNVWTPAANVLLLGTQSVAQDTATGYLYMCEYITVSAGTLATASVWRSTDDGLTWSIFQTFNRSGAGAIRHIHSCQYDTVSARMWFCIGDGEDAAGLYRVNSGGTALEAIVTNANIAAQDPDWQVAATAVSVMFFPTHIAWGMDATCDAYIFRMARTEIGDPSPTVERVARVSSTVWWSVKASDDGTEWVTCASNEAAPSVGTPLDSAVHLYRVGDNGATIDEVMAFSAEGQTSVVSLSPVGSEQGGSLFWLRAHNWTENPWPSVTFSPFAFRARLSWGAVPGTRPLGSRKKFYPGPERASGYGNLAASGTQVFGHTVCPTRTKVLYIFNLGVRKIAGAGTAKVRIRNATTAADLLAAQTWSDYRAVFTEDTSAEVLTYFPTAGDVIEFQLQETGGASTVEATAFVTFAWGF